MNVDGQEENEGSDNLHGEDEVLGMHCKLLRM